MAGPPYFATERGTPVSSVFLDQLGSLGMGPNATLLQRTIAKGKLPPLMAAPPTITIGPNVTGSPASSYPSATQIPGAVLTQATVSGGPFWFGGGVPVAANPIGVTFQGPWANTSKVFLAYSAAYEFDFDGSYDGKFEIFHASNGSKFDILVDAGDGLGWQYAAARGSLTAATGGNSQTVLVNFGGAVQGYRIRVETANLPLWGIGTHPENTLSAPPSDKVTGIFYGDSWDGPGTAATSAVTAHAHMMADLLGIDVSAIGIGGSGLLNPGSQNQTWLLRAPFDLYPRTADFFFSHLSTNDGSYPPSLVASAMTDFLYQLRLQPNWANTPFFIFGMNQGSGTNAAGQTFPQPVYDAVKAVVIAQGEIDGLTFWLDTAGWLNGNGSVAVPTGNGNSDLFIPSAAVNHPNQAGHNYWGQREAAAMRNLIPTLTI